MAKPLNCPNCDYAVPSEHINIDRMVAVCPTCDTIFRFGGGGDEMTAIPITDTSAGASQSSRIAKPKGKRKARKLRSSSRIKVYDDTVTGGIEIHQRHWNSGAIFLTFFVIFWDGFLIMWYTIAFRTGEWVMAAFASIHALVGVVLTYWLLSSYLNKTRIAITSEQVKVTTSPVFVHAPRTFDSESIDQVYVRRTNYQVNGSYHYEVMVSLFGEGNRKLSGGFQEYEDAAYIEQEVEAYLGIEDHPVTGEARQTLY
jgi:hypothetical protein